MTPLNRCAILKADEVRAEHGFDIYEPVNPIDLCLKLGILVKMVSISMEGMYFIDLARTNPAILLSNLRPFPRRFYTCGHELGHHLFGHGVKIDELNAGSQTGSSDEEELLVDCFAGALIMPVAGIEAEFALRNWKPSSATPLQFFTIASIFSVGYETLITHCKVNEIISRSKADQLAKAAPQNILKSLLGASTSISYFKIIDGLTELRTMDLEVNNYIFLPNGIQVEGEQLRHFRESAVGTCYIATCPGIVRVCSKEESFSSFIRIQNAQFEGLAEYRHLEDK